jgi:(Z)-2-((N-methylformamido)methylene)-5-hydroxybutyrolactone dehydrogenase
MKGAAVHKYQLHIDGAWCDPASDQWFDSVNPYTGEAWARIPRANRDDVDRAVRAADRAMREGEWSRMNATQRGHALRRLGDVVARHSQRLAEIEVRDNGKLYAEMSNQCRYLVEWFHYYGGLADKVQGAVPPIDKPHVLNFTRPEPIGVVACITPWNSPLLLMAWKVAPALAAGNAVVIKPSEFTSASTLEFAALAKEAGVPDGVINVVTGYGHEAGDALVSHRLVRKVAFTGGESGGRQVNVAAAADFKHVTLELGGKSANIVFDDARLDDAVSGAISGIFAASGQTCIAGSRLLVQESIHDEVLERLVALAGTARFGDPMSADTQIGPITTEPQYRKVLDYIEIARKEGARCVMGGGAAEPPPGAGGKFVKPTIFADVRPEMRIAQEEVFGPVLCVIKFKDDEDAIRIANGTNYGLAAGVWTESLRRAVEMSNRLVAGTVWVNTYRSTSYTTPFGGYKASGLGRENGLDAIREYLQTKSVWFYTGGPAANPYIRR